MLKSIVIGTLLLGVVLCQPKDLEEPALQFIECVRKALDGGLPAAGIPDHNPLNASSKTFHFGFPGLFEDELVLKEILIENIIDFNVTNLTGRYFHDPGTVLYDFVIEWNQPIIMNLPWYTNFSMGSIVHARDYDEFDGTLTIKINDLSASGTWDMALEVAGQKEHLNNLKLHTSSSISVDFKGFYDDDWDEYLSSLIYMLVDMVANGWLPDLSIALKDKINEDFIGKPDRIDAIIKNCQ